MVGSTDKATVVPASRLEARRQAFLVAAKTVFLEKGYASATLDDIIALSRGSRQTLYALFGGKQGLFEALIAERSQTMLAQFEAELHSDRTLDDVLIKLGIQYLEQLTTQDALKLYRLIIAESTSMEGIADHFWGIGPGHVRSMLTTYFVRQTSRGTLALDDPEDAAQQFLGMLLGNFHLQCLLNLRPSPNHDEIDTIVRTAVPRFLDGCRARA